MYRPFHTKSEMNKKWIQKAQTNLSALLPFWISWRRKRRKFHFLLSYKKNTFMFIYTLKKTVKIGHNILYNLKEFFRIYFLQVLYQYLEFYTSFYCVLELTKCP